MILLCLPLVLLRSYGFVMFSNGFAMFFYGLAMFSYGFAMLSYGFAMLSYDPSPKVIAAQSYSIMFLFS